MWKSGKQGSPALSTAESELNEALEGLVMGDSVDSLAQELTDEPYAKVIKVDNSAAVSLLTEAAGSWRTRHLRLRAAHVRWRLGRLDWLVENIPGLVQLADVGTKSFTAPRLQQLKEMMGMFLEKQPEKMVVKTEQKIEEHGSEGRKIEEVEKSLRIIIALSAVCGADAADEEEEARTGGVDREMIALGTFAIIGVFHCLGTVWRFWKNMKGKKKKEDEEEQIEMIKEDEDEAEVDVGTMKRAKESLRKEEERLKKEKEDRKKTRKCGKTEEGASKKEEEHAKNENEIAKTTEGSELERRGGTQVAGSAASSSSNAPPTPEEGNNESSEEKKVYLTEWGTRAHEERSCPTLKQSKRLYESSVCQVCAKKWDRTKPIYVHYRGQKAHQRIDCRAAEGKLTRMPMCQICSP